MNRILIIDDEECIRETLGEFSEILGYEPTLIADPSLSLPCFDKNECPFEHSCADVLLAEHYLPTMFGLNLIDKLNCKECKIPERARAVITSVLSLQEQDQANTLGCDVLLKPVTFEKLKNWLNAIETVQ